MCETNAAMQQAYILTGHLTDDRTLALDESLPIKSGRVRVVLEVIHDTPANDYARFMAELRERQQKRGHIARSREEVDAALRIERESWDD